MQKYFFYVFFLCATFSSVLMAAGSWEEFFRSLIDQQTGSKIIESGKLYEGNVYSANFKFLITDADGNANNFKGNDRIELQILGTSLAFEGTKDGLVTWAEANGKAIYDAMFPSDVGSAITGGSDAQYTQEAFFPSVILKNLRTENTNNFIARMEFTFSEVGNEEVFSFLGVPSYNINFGEKMQNAVGLIIPFRYAKQDDVSESELFSIGLNPYFRYNVFEQNSSLLEDDRLTIDVGLNPFMHTTFVSSVIFTGGIGYIRFGSGFFTALEWNIADRIKIRSGIAYQISKAYFPDDVVEGDMSWIVDVLNDLPVDHEISFGLNFTIPLAENFNVSLDYFRTHSLSSRVKSSQAFISTVSIFFNYLLLDIVDISLGYKTRFEIEDLNEHTILFGGMVRF